MAYKRASQKIRAWGYTLIAIAVIVFLSDLLLRSLYGSALAVPISMGVVTANMSIALSGIVTLSIANAVVELEKRLDVVEGSKKS